MKAQTAAALALIDRLTPDDWRLVAERASSSKVGGGRWEAAWLAARAGHQAGIAAQAKAIEAGASIVAAAALAGAIAAIEARDHLTDEAFLTLTAPAPLIMRPPGTLSTTLSRVAA